MYRALGFAGVECWGVREFRGLLKAPKFSNSNPAAIPEFPGCFWLGRKVRRRWLTLHKPYMYVCIYIYTSSFYAMRSFT